MSEAIPVHHMELSKSLSYAMPESGRLELEVVWTLHIWADEQPARGKSLVTFAGTAEEIGNSLYVWLERGRPSMAALKAEASNGKPTP